MKQFARNPHSRLVDNISSAYVEGAGALSRRDVRVVYVEGYEDVAFWRSIFDEWERPGLRFEVMTPVRGDLAKGKKVVLSFAPQAGRNLLLCVDSDFDYLFGNDTDQSRLVNSCPYLVQTYVYAIENLMCYPPSLASLTVRATKSDEKIFDFEKFFNSYSAYIHPLFLWYAYAARISRPEIISLSDFRNAVKINYLDIADDGASTLEWLRRGVERKLKSLAAHFPLEKQVAAFGEEIAARGITPATTHLYMQGHCLLENVVTIVVATVCNEMRERHVARIMQSSRQGLSLKNELSYYNNSLREIDTLLTDNIGYRRSPLFDPIRRRIDAICSEVGE